AIFHGLARLAVHRLVVSTVATCRSDRFLYCRPHYSCFSALLGNGVCLVKPDHSHAALHLEPGRTLRRDHGSVLCTNLRLAAWPISNHRAMEHARSISRALYRHPGDRRTDCAPPGAGERRTCRTRPATGETWAGIACLAIGDIGAVVRL